jgi:nicotinamidase-related amidase
MNRALLVIDVQNEYFTGKLKVTHPNGALDNILKAMDAAESLHMPIVVIQNSSPFPESPVFRRNSPEWVLHPEIERRPSSLLMEKNLPGSFTDTGLESFLRKRQIDTVTISGLMTHICCDTTSRQAFHLGFKVEFLSDATGTLSLDNSAGSVTAEDLHRTVLVVQQARFGTVMSTETWIALIGSG